MFNIIAWIVFGIIAGAIAKLIVPGRQGGGFLATAGLGIVGAFLGGIVHNLITKQPLLSLSTKASFSIGSFAIAVLGAIAFIFIWGLVTGRTSES